MELTQSEPLTSMDRAEATRVADENNALRLRIAQLKAEERDRCDANEHTEVSGTDSVEKLRARNDALNERIVEQERRLAELNKVNVTDLYHEFKREEAKRSRLLSENVGLGMIVQNQSREVQRATDAVRSQQKLREQSDEKNSTARSETLLFKKKRQETLEETRRLKAKEKHLEQKLNVLRAAGDDVDATIEMLQCKVAAIKERKDLLERDIAAADGAREEEEQDRQSMDNALTREITELRAQYVQLKDELNSDR